MSVDDHELREAFGAAAGDKGEVTIAGKTVSRLGLVGIVLVDGQNALELDPEEQVKILDGLRRAKDDQVPDHLDPAKNPMIKTD